MFSDGLIVATCSRRLSMSRALCTVACLLVSADGLRLETAMSRRNVARALAASPFAVLAPAFAGRETVAGDGNYKPTWKVCTTTANFTSAILPAHLCTRLYACSAPSTTSVHFSRVMHPHIMARMHSCALLPCVSTTNLTSLYAVR